MSFRALLRGPGMTVVMSPEWIAGDADPFWPKRRSGGVRIRHAEAAQPGRDLAVDGDQDAEALRVRVGGQLEGVIEDEQAQIGDVLLDRRRQRVLGAGPATGSGSTARRASSRSLARAAQSCRMPSRRVAAFIRIVASSSRGDCVAWATFEYAFAP